MKSTSLKLFALTLASASLLLISSCSKEDASAPISDEPVPELKAGNSGPSANGQASLEFNDQVQHLAFHAKENSNGSISGSWEVKSPGQDLRVHGSVECFYVLEDGITAVIAGFITHRVGDGFPEYVVGDPVWFKVQDNGEGANSDPDMFSDVLLGVDGCDNFNYPLFPTVNGNVQVKP